MQFVTICDLVNPDTGKTWRQENAEMTHNIPIGTLVELLDDDGEYAGVRLYVVSHDRDCDMTPLYSMAPRRGDNVRDRDGFANSKWVHGWGEDVLRAVGPP